MFIPTTRFLGFAKDADGEIIINEKEASTVRLIYRLFLEGKTPHYIKKHLEAAGTPSPSGAETWYPKTIISILQNEKYKGDALLQKKYVPDFLTKKVVKNDGVLPQCYVENSHPAIVSKEIWDMAQAEFTRRTEKGRQLCGDNPLTGKIICGECGGAFGSKVWHSTSKYRRTIWRCNNKYKAKGAKKCDLPHVKDETITSAFVAVFNDIYDCKDEVLGNLETAIGDTLSGDKITESIEAGRTELDILDTQINALINKNATTLIDQDDYLKAYRPLSERRKTIAEDIKKHEDAMQGLTARREHSKTFIDALRNQTALLTEFDEGLWHLLIDTVTVHAGRLTLKFRNGLEIEKTI